MALVSLTEVKDHLRITGFAEDADLGLKRDAAEAIVLNYLNTTAWWRVVTATWTSANVPRAIHQAILVQCAELYGFRGDDPATVTTSGSQTSGDLSPVVTNLLRRYRDPVVA